MTDVIAVFAKAPQPGRVKTRLQPTLEPDEAAAFYEASLKDVIENVKKMDLDLQIVYDDVDGAEGYFSNAYPEVTRAPQSEGDLGDRLAAWCETAFAAGAQRVLMIGADSPTLPPSFIADAQRALAEADLVFGPAEDGGYYLVGIASGAWPSARRIFEGIAWSTPEVLRQSLDRARAVPLSCRLVSKWYDIDEIGDLKRAQDDAAASSSVASWLKARLLAGGGASPQV